MSISHLYVKLTGVLTKRSGKPLVKIFRIEKRGRKPPSVFFNKTVGVETIKLLRAPLQLYPCSKAFPHASEHGGTCVVDQL
jgi:hypothetical protein